MSLIRRLATDTDCNGVTCVASLGDKVMSNVVVMDWDKFRQLATNMKDTMGITQFERAGDMVKAICLNTETAQYFRVSEKK